MISFALSTTEQCDSDAALAGLRDPIIGAPKGTLTGVGTASPGLEATFHRPRKVSICLRVNDQSQELGVGADLDLDELVRVLTLRDLAGRRCLDLSAGDVERLTVSAMRPRMLFLSRLVTADFYLTALPASGRPGNGRSD